MYSTCIEAGAEPVHKERRFFQESPSKEEKPGARGILFTVVRVEAFKFPGYTRERLPSLQH